jgi:hypothetical protein
MLAFFTVLYHRKKTSGAAPPAKEANRFPGHYSAIKGLLY